MVRWWPPGVNAHGVLGCTQGETFLNVHRAKEEETASITPGTSDTALENYLHLPDYIHSVADFVRHRQRLERALQGCRSVIQPDPACRRAPSPLPPRGCGRHCRAMSAGVGPQGSAQSGNDYLTVSPHLLPVWPGTVLPLAATIVTAPSLGCPLLSQCHRCPLPGPC